MRRTVLALLLGLSLICGCSDDDGESITDVCTAKCDVDKDKCLTYYNFCLNKCKQVATDADSKYISGCGLCVARSFKYYFDPTTKQCLGPQNKTATDKECLSACFLPDGGMGI